MACPETNTLRNLTGRFKTNRQLSDISEPLLALQGIGWAIRKVMGAMPVVVSIKQCPAEDGVDVIEAENVIGGGIRRIKGAPQAQLGAYLSQNKGHLLSHQAPGNCIRPTTTLLRGSQSIYRAS
ncbi:hypothetical protein DL767_007704 [Monosporascus sp. MG133]|nr:hypothetical protein DL767_007704 [Monosporascus sp. MG133]